MIGDKLNIFMFLAGLVVATADFAALFFVKAPYGRHICSGWGPVISNHFAWVII